MTDSGQRRAFAYVLGAITSARTANELQRIEALARAHYDGEMLERVEDALAVRAGQLDAMAALKRSRQTPPRSPAVDVLAHSYDVFLKVIPTATSLAELEDIRSLATTQCEGRGLRDVEEALATRARELDTRQH